MQGQTVTKAAPSTKRAYSFPKSRKRPLQHSKSALMQPTSKPLQSIGVARNQTSKKPQMPTPCMMVTGKKPSVTGRNGDAIVDEDEIYSGVWAWVCVTFCGYKVNGKCGMAAALEAVRKCKDDEQFGGSVSQNEAFGSIPMDDEDDEDL